MWTEQVEKREHGDELVVRSMGIPLVAVTLFVLLVLHMEPMDLGAIPQFAYHGAATAPNGYYGFIGTMDVYGFSLAKGQGSAAAVWISDEGDGAPSSLKNIMIGWDVLPDLYGDSKTHFYTKWTNDGFQSSGCLNMKCNGFQPEKGAEILVTCVQDGTSGDWLVHCGLDREPQLIGRFPRSLFTGGFADRAVGVTFGGVVSAPITKPTPMGSGYLPTDVNSAASISNIQLVDQNGRAWPVTGDLPKLERNRNAYAVNPIVNGRFFYGGHEQPVA
ncbi:hypothetical protein BAE44_0016848 [Dichanthelium oligosanthes]|uniref:Neprosin PEP catalytic domain-containing protein n=1 Tax=Dichanthelium oligosanthes TaxID=888268 RepID=A0A1E5VAE5_9POAL|nr:hypothetical protein BAE44_0016848 [Dichanthelium oligosanthes]